MALLWQERLLKRKDHGWLPSYIEGRKLLRRIAQSA